MITKVVFKPHVTGQEIQQWRCSITAEVSETEGSEPVGLLLSRDLIFTSKITGTARALSHRVLVAGNSALAETMIGQRKPLVVFVDLSAGELVGPSALLAYRKATPGTPFVAFGSHVDTIALEAAREAGCELVLPRSKFSAELPELIRKYFGEIK